MFSITKHDNTPFVESGDAITIIYNVEWHNSRVVSIVHNQYVQLKLFETMSEFLIHITQCHVKRLSTIWSF